MKDKKAIIIGVIILLLLLTFIGVYSSSQDVFKSDSGSSTENAGQNDDEVTDIPSNQADDQPGVGGEVSREEEPTYTPFKIQMFEGEPHILLQDLVASYQGKLHYDPVEGIIEISVDLYQFRLLREATVLERDGIYLPVESKPIIENDGEKIWVPLSFVTEGMERKIKGNPAQDDVIAIEDRDLADLSEKASAGKDSSGVVLETMGTGDLVDYLSFLSVPIQGARISERDSHLPGAPRTYRNGIHEGIDWYGGYIGVPVSDQTPVYSMADGGVVVRADHDYREMTFAERDAFLEQARQLKITPEYILDKMRGRSVWIQYERGVLVRYVHLSDIPEDIQVGTTVSKRDIIGYVGNSGTSYGLEGSPEGMHLHSDILIYGDVFWKYIEQEQVRNVLQQIFNGTENQQQEEL